MQDKGEGPGRTARRSFLKLGIGGSLLLAVGAGAAWRRGWPDPGPFAARPFVPNAAARTILSAIVPVMLGSSLPLEPAARATALAGAVNATFAAIATLAPGAQGEVRDLFSLLSLAPARRWLAGIGDGWEQASPDQVAAFLQGWRGHRLRLLQPAYLALHDLILGAWYADPAHWADIGYPGPIAELA